MDTLNKEAVTKDTKITVFDTNVKHMTPEYIDTLYKALYENTLEVNGSASGKDMLSFTSTFIYRWNTMKKFKDVTLVVSRSNTYINDIYVHYDKTLTWIIGSNNASLINFLHGKNYPNTTLVNGKLIVSKIKYSLYLNISEQLATGGINEFLHLYEILQISPYYLSYFLEHDPECIEEYLEHHPEDYIQFADLCKNEASYIPLIISIGKKYINNIRELPAKRDKARIHVVDAMFSKNEKLTPEELKECLGMLLWCIDDTTKGDDVKDDGTCYAQRLINNIFLELVGLPMGTKLEFDIKNGKETIMSLCKLIKKDDFVRTGHLHNDDFECLFNLIPIGPIGNQQLINKLVAEYIGLPVGTDLGFDVYTNVDTLINLGKMITK